MQPDAAVPSPYELARRWFAARIAMALRLDADRLWQGRDLEAGEIPWECGVTQRLGSKRVLLSALALLLFTLLVSVVWWWLPMQAHGWWRVIAGLGAGVVLHGAFILVVHEAAHRNLFGRRSDRWLGALATGALLLPFVAGRYARTHLIHHARANRLGDNNWTPLRERLYRRSRLAYVLYELLPVVNNLDRLAGQTERADHVAALVAWLVAVVVWWTAQVELEWYGWCLLGLTAMNAARLWVEHMGPAIGHGRLANTYGGCPLGFGIGHHALHHRHPQVPAPILMVGLWLRRHDAHVLTGWWHLLHDRSWCHFSTVDAQRSWEGTD
jgi:fatty acid desaturase